MDCGLIGSFEGLRLRCGKATPATGERRGTSLTVALRSTSKSYEKQSDVEKGVA